MKPIEYWQSSLQDYLHKRWHEPLWFSSPRVSFACVVLPSFVIKDEHTVKILHFRENTYVISYRINRNPSLSSVIHQKVLCPHKRYFELYAPWWCPFLKQVILQTFLGDQGTAFIAFLAWLYRKNYLRGWRAR